MEGPAGISGPKVDLHILMMLFKAKIIAERNVINN